MFLAVNMGGSNTAPSFSAAYGANILRRDAVPGLFGLCVFLGAIIAGKEVVKTIGTGIFPEQAMSLGRTTIILLSISLSVFFANLLKVPQCTSQSTVAALVGVALYFDMLKTDKLLLEIIPAWFILPILAFVVSVIVGKLFYRQLRRGTIGFARVARHSSVKVTVVLASCYVAFAAGANNVANAAGPISSMIFNEFEIPHNPENFQLCMILATLMIAPCFGIGSSIFGARVLETTGKEIIDFGPMGATLISLITATLLLFASVTKGIPASLVQLNTGAIIGLGVCKIGVKGILTHTAVRKVFAVWLVAPLIAMLLALMLTFLADRIGLI